MNFIISTPEQLEEIVQKAVKKALSVEIAEKPQQTPDACSSDQALIFLREHGYPMSKSRLYKMTAKKEMPFRYFGRKIVFSKTELLRWVEGQTRPSSNTAEIVMSLAGSARRKQNRKKEKSGLNH